MIATSVFLQVLILKMDEINNQTAIQKEESYDPRKVSPNLVIDLDGDGIETKSLSDEIYFDYNGDKFATKTEWPGESEGILVRDLNGNKKIDNGTELFGNHTVLRNGETAANGFEALKELDLNGDGFFSASEADETGVEIWIDSISDGRSANTERYGFWELGIESINLNDEEMKYLDADANEYIINEKMNGKAVDIIDLWLNYEIIFSVYTEHIVIPNDIYRLPNIEGIGRAWSLHQAMTLDESGKLKDLVVEFTKETDRDRRLEIAEQILYDWTREETVTGVLSELYNNDYTGVTEPKVLKNFNDAFEGFVIDVYENLMAASHLQKYYETRVRNSEGKEDMTVAAQDLLELLAEDQDAGEKVLADLVSNIHELLLVNEFEYDDFRDILNNANPRYGVIADGVHSNNVFGSSKLNRMSGEAEANNIFFIMDGSHTIQGGMKNDTYVFGKLSGGNEIKDTGGEDILLLGQDINQDTVKIEQIFPDSSAKECDLKITIDNTEKFIMIKNYKDDHKMSIMFSNGQSVDISDLLNYE